MGVSGFRRTISALEEVTEEVRGEVEGALMEEAEEIMTDSKKNFVPVDTGALRSSGFVRPPRKTVRGPRVTIGFGGPAGSRNGTGRHDGEVDVEGDDVDGDIGYAAVQHERLDYDHTVGEAKYLEKPALMAEATMEGRFARRLEARLDL